MADKNFCTNCGNTLNSDDIFCGRCGQPVDEEGNQTETNSINKTVVSNNIDEERYKRVKSDRLKFPKKVGYLITGIISFIILFFVIGSAYILADNGTIYRSNFFVFLISRYSFFYISAGVSLFVISFFHLKLNMQIFLKERMSFKDFLLKKYGLFSNLQNYAKTYFIFYLISAFLFAAFMLVLLTIPGTVTPLILMILLAAAFFYFNSRFVFSLLLVLDQNKNTSSSFRKSYKLTEGKIVDYAGIIIAIFIINYFAAKTYMLGYIITFPLSFYLLTKVYYDLKESKS
ncbi:MULTISPECIES: zinc-ribbon domain-containing protein [unclassified Halanaerobium]|uniref:zinc-ribbon domain-containing protein n=1 Tax=unclassified Halanaerobium TaxID=2641197 RepID=UPI000E1AB6CB|nr:MULTISPECIES: zinc-ribbon domain-containing protein [unclassified Halanaerobium]RCW44406.1 zinc ribbon protein [Halanaerobium sp. MA284_MarDTE_T2]RCW86543.1 zinc ribbon protein [Halanaerobium sp. DL-01]